MDAFKILLGVFVLGVVALILIVGAIPFYSWGLSRSIGHPLEYNDLLSERSTPPEWTTDGTKLVFFHNGVTYIVDATGSRLRSLDDSVSPDISPDGARIAYTAYEHSTGWFPWNRDRDWEIVSSKLDGSDRRRLTRTEGIDFNPVWSPDGAQIAFWSPIDGYRARIHVVGADGSGARSPTSLTVAKQPVVWSPDSQRLAFVAIEGGSRALPVLYTVAVDRSGLTKIAEGAGLPAWSPDGRRLAFEAKQKIGAAQTVKRALYIAGKDGSASEELIVFPKGDFTWTDNISWSPDGSEIMLGPVVNRDDRSHFLLGTFIFKADGSAFRTLPTREGLASWNPDGSRIAVYLPIGGYASSPRYRYYASGVLYTMAADGTDIRVLVEQDEDGNLTAANGRPLSDDRDVFETHSLCLELAEPGVLKHCEEE